MADVMKIVHILPPSLPKEGGFVKDKLIGPSFIIFFISFLFFTVSPGQASSPAVVQIKIQGNEVIKEDEIRKVILSKPEAPLSEDKVRKDLQAIYEMGCFSRVKALKESVPEGVVLIYEVKEYPVVNSIEFTGVKDAGLEKKLKELITLNKEEPWNYKKAQKSRDKILDYFKKEGYTQAQVSFSSPSGGKESFVAAFSIDKGQRARVVEVEISGNHFLPDTKIRYFMQTGFKGYFDPEVLREDIKKVSTEYQNKGFYFASIDIEEFKFFEKYRVRWVRIFLKVDEGKRFKMGNLHIEGNQIFSDEEIRSRVRPTEGQIFNTAKLKESIRRIENIYGQKGYIYANVSNTLQFNQDEATVDVELSIQENDQIRIGEIRVEGNKKTKWEAFKHTLLLDSGDIFNTNKMIESWRRLYNLGFFEKIEMQPVGTSDPGVVDLLIRAEEKKKTGKFLLGASYSSNFGFEGFIQFSKDNLWGEGKMLSVDWEFGKRRNNYRVKYLDRWWQDTSTRLELNLYSKQHKFYQDNNEGYIKREAGGEISLGRPWFSNFDLSLALKRETATIRRIEGKDLPEGLEEGEKTYQSVRPALVWDSRVRDTAFNSYKGEYALFSVEKSGGFLGGDVNFAKYSVDMRGYFRYGKVWTLPILALRLRGKWGDNLPLDEQFYIGGQDTLRGYKVNEFRGSQALLGTMELRFPLTRNFLAYLFLDAGKTISMENYKTGYGFGIKMNSPLGIIRLDYGVGKEGEAHFYFGMGDVF